MARIIFLALALMLTCTACNAVKTWQTEGAVKKALAADARTRKYDFQITAAEDGTVTISGEVDQPKDLDAVTLIAKAVPGVSKVLNRCSTPEPSNNGLLDDTVIPSAAVP